MSTDLIDLMRLGERLADVRRTYGDSIDLPKLSPALFAMLLGVPTATYQSYECGETEPSADFLVTLRRKTGVSLDWLLDPNQRASY
jgi:transcriptional regulator with XRE-family HTH domain